MRQPVRKISLYPRLAPWVPHTRAQLQVALVDESARIGCSGDCVQVLMGMQVYTSGKKVADKCMLCHHRTKKRTCPGLHGGMPSKARIFGDLRDRESELVKFLRDNDYQVETASEYRFETIL